MQKRMPCQTPQIGSPIAARTTRYPRIQETCAIYLQPSQMQSAGRVPEQRAGDLGIRLFDEIGAVLQVG